MEKKTPIRQKDTAISEGVYIELYCYMCGREQVIAAEDKRTLCETIKDEGWQTLSSDLYGSIGHYCGCDYSDYPNN